MVRIITSDSNAGEDHIHACNRANILMDDLFGNCTLQVLVDTVEVILCKYSRQLLVLHQEKCSKNNILYIMVM